MFNLVINALNQYIKNIYNQYGMNFEVVYSSDLDDLKQYTNNFNYRAIYRNDETVRMLDELQKKFRNTEDYALLLYNFEPPKLTKDKFNNLNLKSYFTDGKTFDMQRVPIEPGAKEFLKSIKTDSTMNNNIYMVRDVKVVEMHVNYKLFSPSQEFIDNFTMLYLTDIQRNLKIPVTIDFGNYVGKHKIDMFPNFEEIESWGLVDTSRAADLRQVGFSTTITSPVFSNFTDSVTGFRDITLSLDVV